MPIYEYRCPNGHTFELFQRMTDPPPSECQICGESPLEKVLYPAAIHFKGSGFYKTDYGRGSGEARRRQARQVGLLREEGEDRLEAREVRKEIREENRRGLGLGEQRPRRLEIPFVDEDLSRAPRS